MKTYAVSAVIAIGVAILLARSVYTVAPNEVAYVTRFGNVVSNQPETSGLHFKVPLIDGVDAIAISLGQLNIDRALLRPNARLHHSTIMGRGG